MRLAIPMIPSRFELHHSTRPPFSHIRPAAHRPLPATCGTHSWVFGICLSLECLPEPLSTTKNKSASAGRSTLTPFSILPTPCRAHTHSLPDPSVTADGPLHLGRPLPPLLVDFIFSSGPDQTRPGTTPGSDTPPPPHLGSQIRWSCAFPDKGRLRQLGNLATSPWYKQADPGGPFFHAPPSEVIIHSFRPSTSTWTTSCPIHQTAAPATALFFMR